MSNSTSTSAQVVPTNRISGLPGIDDPKPVRYYSGSFTVPDPDEKNGQSEPDQVGHPDRCKPARDAQSRRKGQGRNYTVRRVLVLIDLLRCRRFPALTGEVHEELNDRMAEDYSQRSIRRDLELLQTAGLVSRSGRPSRAGQDFAVWTWNGFDSLYIDGGSQQ